MENVEYGFWSARCISLRVRGKGIDNSKEKKRSMVRFPNPPTDRPNQPNEMINVFEQLIYARSTFYSLCTINNIFIHKYSLTGARTFYSMFAYKHTRHSTAYSQRIQREQQQRAKSTDHTKYWISLYIPNCLSLSLFLLLSRQGKNWCWVFFFSLSSERNVISIIISSSFFFSLYLAFSLSVRLKFVCVRACVSEKVCHGSCCWKLFLH